MTAGQFGHPHIGRILQGQCDFTHLEVGGDGLFIPGRDGVEAVLSPADRKAEFICYPDKTLCYVKSSMGHPAIYPMEEARIDHPVKAVLMDLDGTSVRSEGFWVRVIEMTTARLLGNPRFELEEDDLPHVSGHSVSEHLLYCIRKYCPDKTVEAARERYLEIARDQMRLIAEGRGWKDAFMPAPGLKEFLLKLKSLEVKIGLVTSGIHEKAWPEIVSAFKTMGMGDPKDFYDAIITAGFQPGRHEPGTLGELSPKPHPWLYAETCRVGLGIHRSDRHHVVGLEDSSAGVLSIRLAGYAAIGIGGGNIAQSGTRCLCSHLCDNLEEALPIIIGGD